MVLHLPKQVPQLFARASAHVAALLLPVLAGAQTVSDHFHTYLLTLADGNTVLTSDDEIFADGFEPPRLGAHVLLTQDESLGTPLATTPAIATQARGSSFIAISMGWNVNFATPFDNYNNTWTPLSAMNVYAGGDYYTAVWAATMGKGGSGHTLSVTKTGRPSGEISLELMEVINGGDVQLVYRLAPAGNETPGSVTVSGPATLIAIWAGDSFELSHTAVPNNGFVVFDSYLKLGPSSGVQVALALKQVTAAGTYTVNWASTPFQNAACYLIAVQRLP